jgi:hypothetical protein
MKNPIKYKKKIVKKTDITDKIKKEIRKICKNHPKIKQKYQRFRQKTVLCDGLGGYRVTTTTYFREF